MGYKITAGAEYFYAGYGTSSGMNHGCCRMKDPVDGECLRKAVETAMQRYPYFRVKAVLKHDEYIMVSFLLLTEYGPVLNVEVY